MRHHNSVFHGVLKHVPWGEFDRLVEEHGADARVRRLTTRRQLIALLYGQLAGATSLREIEAAMASQHGAAVPPGRRRCARSTLADANAPRPPVFADLFAHMLAQARRGLRRACATPPI